MNKTNIICDTDGTIPDLVYRVTYLRNLHDDPNWKADWSKLISDGQARIGRSYYDASAHPFETVLDIVRRREMKQSGHNLYYLSGRNVTAGYIMGKSAAREELAKLGITPDNTLCVFDDNLAVVDMWRNLGFLVTCVTA